MPWSSKCFLFNYENPSLDSPIPIFFLKLDTSLKKLPPAVEENKYRNSKLDNIQRVRDIGTLSPQWVVSIKSFTSWLRELCVRGGREGDVRASEAGRYQGNGAL